MKFKFSRNLDYQLDAINAVTGLFDGSKINDQRFDKTDFRLMDASQVVGNKLDIDSERLLENLRVIQKQNNISSDNNAGLPNGTTFDDPRYTFDGDYNIGDSLESMDFSVEMETGTGKTYVYLRTILELNQKYSLKKFIILVPSVAIREGVLKTIEQTHEHFRKLYNTAFAAFAYDSSKLNRVRDFAQSNDAQIMIMTIQSFNTDTNIMNQAPDRFYGNKPIEWVAETCPVIIMDEPQNMESELSKAAIQNLNPLFKLRYSATHKNIHNLVYRLTPVDAYLGGLVKKIEVYGTEINQSNDVIFEVESIIAKKGESPTARVLIEVKGIDSSYEKRIITVKVHDSIYGKSKKNSKYDKDLVVNDIRPKEGVELSNGRVYQIADKIQHKEELFRTQIRETIRAHMRKQQELGSRIKVLSLFFIDEVKNYRGEDPIIKTIFEEEFTVLRQWYEHFKNMEPSVVHDGYFSQDRQGEGRRSQDVSSEGKRDRLTYDLIMKNKELLLSFEEPVSFIFSHSALKEGWDNPNIFQICTLIETHDDFTKRQKIGRGLRLPVDIEGDRVYDSAVNILTIIANESYEEFASGLQREYTDAGYANAPRPPNVRDRISVSLRKDITGYTDFKILWEKISKKTKYNLHIDTEELVKECAAVVSDDFSVYSLSVGVRRGQIEMTKEGILNTVYMGESVGEKVVSHLAINNIIQRISEETNLTRRTVFEVIDQSDTWETVLVNPEDYIRRLVKVINACKDNLLIEGIQYIEIGETWSMELFESFDSYVSQVIPAEKSIYSHVVYDSDSEREFAENLEHRRDIVLFAKLPRWFVVDTPIGSYNPDWAIVVKEDAGNRLYLVRETKFVDDIANLRPSEKLKVACGEKHFHTIGVDFRVVTKRSLEDLISDNSEAKNVSKSL